MNDLGFITLSNGQVAIVDAAALPLVTPYRWCPMRKRDGRVYAQAHGPRRDGTQSTILMHSLILGTPKGMASDHQNHDGLDNRRSNLRACTRAQNLSNRGKTIANTSGYKGVDWVKRIGTWRAQIGVQNKHLFLGHFTDPVAAARAYDAAARRLHGEFARTNFAEETT